MKVQVRAHKCQCQRHLGSDAFLASKNWRKSCFTKKRPLAVLREENAMINLDQVKVTPRDKQVLNLLVQGCSNKGDCGTT